MDCNANMLGITSLILTAMSKNPALLQKVLRDLFRMPERQELFPGLLNFPHKGKMIHEVYDPP